MTKNNIAVLGAGNMGTALAQVLAKRGHFVRLWDYNPKTVAAIKKSGTNAQFLPGIKLSNNIVPEASMKSAIENAQLVIVACASPYVRTTTRHFEHCLDGRKVIVAHIAKGMEAKTNLTMHEVVQSELPPLLRRGVVTLCGPSIANELVRDMPTAVVAASQDARAAEFVKKVFESDALKMTTSNDYRGVGLCSALKNVYAIALGMCDGIRLTMNAKAFMLTRALQEMGKIVGVFGGKRETVYGLAGLGDMIVTGFGDGRNRALGERICKDGHCRFVWQKNSPTFEGVAATKAFYELSRRKKISAPLINLVYRVLYQSADPCTAITKFFATAKL